MSELKVFDVGLGQYCEDGSPCVVAFDADKNPRLLNEKVYLKSEADKVIAELKAREDVLVTDNRNLLDKVKKLEERLHENAEHFKRNELQILENSDKVIAEKDKEIAELQKQVHDYAQGLYVIQARAEKEARHHKYKRCMAMAKWCFTKSNYHFVLARHGEDAKENNRKSILYSKWCKRWLAIADKYKEGNV